MSKSFVLDSTEFLALIFKIFMFFCYLYGLYVFVSDHYTLMDLEKKVYGLQEALKVIS
jgi:hypothetical protein